MANRRKRSNKPQNIAKPAPSVPNGVGSVGFVPGVGLADDQTNPLNFASGYDASRPSDARGWTRWATIDPRQELDQFTREQLLKESRWLQANVGFAHRGVTGMADLVGYLTPQAATSDSKWNQEAEEHFMEMALEPTLFDRTGVLDFFSWQVEQTKSDLGDGDSLTVLSESETGSAQIVFYGAHHVRSMRAKVPKSKNPELETDGVTTDRMGRAKYYGIVSGYGQKAVGKKIRARDAIFSANFERHGRVRGVTALARAINHSKDIAESNASVKSAIKAAGEYVFQITQQQSGAMPFHPLAQQGTTVEYDAAGNEIVADGAGPAGSQKIKQEEIITSGATALQFDGGKRLELITDNRPGSNYLDFINHLMRDIAWGIGVAPEVLWMMSGLTGPGVRFVMKDLNKWIKKRQDKRLRDVKKYWAYFWAKEFANGYPMPTDPRWWKCEWIPIADITIDEGRDGNLEMKRYEKGAETLAAIYGRQGRKWDRQLEQRGREIDKAVELAAASAADDVTWRDFLPVHDKKGQPVVDPKSNQKN